MEIFDVEKNKTTKKVKKPKTSMYLGVLLLSCCVGYIMSCCHVLGIAIQVMLARFMIIRVYKHDPFHICYYFVTHTWKLLLTLHLGAMAYAFR